MPSAYTPSAPDKQQVRLRVMDEHVELTRWISYSFKSNFLTPSDGWECVVADGKLADNQRRALRIGARVRLYVENNPLAEGYIDSVEIGASRGAGVTYTIHGRDRLGPVVDAVADPRAEYKTGTTLTDFLKQALAPFGWLNDEHFVFDNAANRDAKTGGLRGIKLTKGGKKKGPHASKEFTLHQLKPHNHEGLFRFLRRVTERFGLWIKVSADGEQIIVAAPDFTQEPRYFLRRLNDGSNGRNGGTNILSGSVRFDGTDQPSVIIADSFSGGGEFGHGSHKAYCVNPYFGYDDQGFISDEVAAILKEYPEAEPVLFVTQPFTRRAPRMPPRPAFLHDDESQTPEQLKFFVKRTMSELLRRSLVCHYRVEGHGQSVDGAFIPWDTDTVVDVNDEVAGVSERMYVLGRDFEKSRNGGTFTDLELVRLYSIASGNQEELKAKPGLVANTKPKREHEPLQIDDPARHRNPTGFSRGQ